MNYCLNCGRRWPDGVGVSLGSECPHGITTTNPNPISRDEPKPYMKLICRVLSHRFKESRPYTMEGILICSRCRLTKWRDF